MNAVMYTIFAILAVYGAYTIVREIVLFFTDMYGDDDKGDGCSLCDGCGGCTHCDDVDTTDKADKETSDTDEESSSE